MLYEDEVQVPPGRSGDDRDAALDAALAAADDDMLAAISSGLDLDAGLARVLRDLGGSAAVGQAARAAASPGVELGRPAGAVSLDRFPPVRIRDAGAAPVDAAALIRSVNAADEKAEKLCLRVRHAAGVAARSARTAEQAAAEAREAAVAHAEIQAGQPRRHAPLPRQVIFALATAVLDGVACYFAAQALGSSTGSALAWASLFLAVLAGGEVALDFYRDRGQRAWSALVVLTGLVVVLLGTLRFWFLAGAGTGSLVPTITGACLFTGVTAGLVFAGYRALGAAETPSAWRARRRAVTARRAAQSARSAAERDVAARDHLLDGYLVYVGRLSPDACPAGRQLAARSAVRQHLAGEFPLGEKEAWRRSGSLGQS